MEERPKVQISCEFGHVYDIDREMVAKFHNDPDLVGNIAFCQIEVAKPEAANAILPCGGRIGWGWKKVIRGLDKAESK